MIAQTSGQDTPNKRRPANENHAKFVSRFNTRSDMDLWDFPVVTSPIGIASS
jgi:hypothetical protein